MCHVFFIPASVDGHIGCFCVLAIVNSAALDKGCMYLSELEFCPGICPGVGLLDHMVILFLVFCGAFILFSIVVVPTYTPTSSVGGSLFSTPSPAFIICRFFDGSHFEQCEVIPHYSFDLHFTND